MKLTIDKTIIAWIVSVISAISMFTLFGFYTKNQPQPTMTYVDQITITSIPMYRDIEQALRDEDLPTGALFIISGEDYIRIKKYQL